MDNTSNGNNTNHIALTKLLTMCNWGLSGNEAEITICAKAKESAMKNSNFKYELISLFSQDIERLNFQ